MNPEGVCITKMVNTIKTFIDWANHENKDGKNTWGYFFGYL